VVRANGPSGRRPTMEDVAARAGVSRALVSIVFRDAPGAGETTRARVRQAAADLGYRPDNRARLLGRSRTGLIGVVFGVEHAFHGDLVGELYTAAERSRYDLALSAVAPGRDEARAVESLLDYRCEALILLGPSARAAALADLASRVPTVVLARRVSAAGVFVVRTDDVDGIGQAVRHLAGLGHRDIAHVDGGRAPGAAERRRGYRATMRDLGLEDHVRIIPGGLTEASGDAAARALLEGGHRSKTPELPTALAVFNDQCAIGVLDTLRQAGVDVPGRISVVGYDDDRLARLAHVDLTTVRQDVSGLASLAVRAAMEGMAMERMATATRDGRETVVPPTLVGRGTTSRCVRA
jgi:DNA-binding LacI/PurR family transcriptional regulator